MFVLLVVQLLLPAFLVAHLALWHQVQAAGQMALVRGAHMIVFLCGAYQVN